MTNQRAAVTAHLGCDKSPAVDLFEKSLAAPVLPVSYESLTELHQVCHQPATFPWINSRGALPMLYKYEAMLFIIELQFLRRGNRLLFTKAAGFGSLPTPFGDASRLKYIVDILRL